MKITEKERNRRMFKEVLTGQVFKAGQSYFMKIIYKPDIGQTFNAVGLYDGKVAIFSQEAETIDVEAELIVKEK